MSERFYKQQRQAARTPARKFDKTCDRLRQGGFVPIPLDGKKPIPKKWQTCWRNPMSNGTYARWRKVHAKANVGLCLGEVIAVDIDIDDKAKADAMQETVFRILGKSLFIRVGREPRRTIFYRLTLVEAAQMSGWNAGAVQLLAAGQQSVIFGSHPDTNKSFDWPARDLLGASINDLPWVSLESLGALKAELGGKPVPEATAEPTVREAFTRDYLPAVGERDKYLFWFAKEAAPGASTLEDLQSIVLAKNQTFDQPLSDGEALLKANSAWGYKERGQLRLSGSEAKLILPITRVYAAERLPRLSPYAAKLYSCLAATRDDRTDFSIPQQATAAAFNMSKATLQKALKELMTEGLIVDTGKTRGGSRNWRAAKRYRFGSGVASVKASVNASNDWL